jgi:polar amino acid transport system permease protein
VSSPTRREIYERSRRRSSVVIATVSTFVAVAVVVALVTRAPRWDQVKQSFFDRDVLIDSLPELFSAFWLDV